MRHGEIIKWTVLGALLLVVVTAVFFILSRKDIWQVQIGTQVVTAKIADSPSERSRGLSGTGNLGEDQALLMIFDQSDYWSIWMKDMNYSIDIVWLDDSKKVVHVAKDISPDTYPTSFRPNVPARYVLELPAGFADKHNITTGTLAVFRPTLW